MRIDLNSTHSYRTFCGLIIISLTACGGGGNGEGKNDPPTATITAPADGATHTSTENIVFSGNANDPEDGALSGTNVLWTSSLDGDVGTGTSVTTALSAGEHVITLTATDSDGVSSTDTVTITVHHPPTATINSPTNGATHTSIEDIAFSATTTDPEDGALTGASVEWTSDVDGDLGIDTSLSSRLSVGVHVITLTATDSKGASATDSVSITIHNAPTATITEIRRASNTGLVAYYPFSGNADDESDNSNNGIVSGAELTSDRFGVGDSAYRFDGVNDYIDIGNDTSLKPQLPVTIAAWVNLADDDPQMVFANDFVENRYYGVWLSVRSDQVHTGYGDSGGTAPQSRRSKKREITVTKDEWHHVVGVIRGESDMHLYLDGVDIEGFYEGSGGAIAYSSDSGNIGRFDTSGVLPPYYYGGDIDDIRLYARALNAAEVIELYDSKTLSFLTTDTVTFSGSGSDIEDGALIGTSLVWSSSIDGQLGTGRAVSVSNLSAGAHTITLTVTDSQGGTFEAVDSVTVTPPSPFENGSFEVGPPIPDGSNIITLPSGSTVVPGWTVIRGTVDVIGPPWNASDGVRAIDLDGESPGVIQQSFITTAGETYSVTFDVSGNPFGSPDVKKLRATVGSVSEDFTYDTSGQGQTTLVDWEQRSFDFIATSSISTLSFLSLSSSPSARNGALIDNVSIEPKLQTSVLLPEYDPLLVFTNCSWTYEWTIGPETGRQFITSTGGIEDVNYSTGTLSGTVINNIEEDHSDVTLNDGQSFRLLRTGDSYLSSDDAMTAHEDSFSFGLISRGERANLGGFACDSADPTQCTAITDVDVLFDIQDVIVNGTQYPNAVLWWWLELATPYTELTLPSRFGIAPPTAVDTGGSAVSFLSVFGLGVGRIAEINVVADDGGVSDASELQAAPTCN